MEKRFERTLSQILNLLVIIVFVTTLVTINTNIWVITYIWAISFLIAWVLMLVYAFHVLFQNNSYGYSILTAIITAIAFGLLSIPAILVLARFIPQLPAGLSFGVGLLDQNNQLLIYTSLIVLYFIHLINIIKLKRKIGEGEIYTEPDHVKDHTDELEEEAEIIEVSKPEAIDDSEISENELITISKTDEFESQTTNISSEDLEIGEKIVFESNIDEKEEYNIDNVRLVEDLTQEDIENMKGDENNG